MKNIYITKGKTIEEQYFEVGKLHAKYIRESVIKNKRKWGSKKIKRRKLLTKIFELTKNNPVTKEFFLCLEAWAKGARVSTKEAFELLDDNTGCQTVIARYANGIALIHTEEELDDIKARMTPPQIIQFTFGKMKRFTLVYNNLMPGVATFGWNNDFAVAIDALFLREDEQESLLSPTLANIVSWIIWRGAGKKFKVKAITQLIKSVGECVDGYAINLLINNKVPTANKILYTRDCVQIDKLGEKRGSYLKQINIFNSEDIKEKKEITGWRLPYRNFYRGYPKYYQQRLSTLENDTTTYLYLTKQTVRNKRKAQEVIINEVCGPLKTHYLNEVVGAVCVSLMDFRGVSTAIALIEDSELKKIEYF